QRAMANKRVSSPDGWVSSVPLDNARPASTRACFITEPEARLFSRDGASGRLHEVSAAPVRLTGRSRTTLWDAEPEGWVGEQEDGPTCLTSCLRKIPRFHIRVKQESQNVGLEIASAVEVSAERRL